MSIVTVIKKRSTILPTFAMSLLILFSHQLASVLFFAIFFWQLLTYENKKEKSFATAILAIVPLVLIFGWQIWGQFISPTFNAHFVPLHLPNGTNIFGFTNYFLSDPRFIGGNYLTILNYVGSLSLFSIVALIPFAIMGFSKDRVFLPMLLWLLPASFSILVFPWFALQMYWWWILLLPIPLTVYIGGYLDKSRMFESRGSSRRRKLGIALSIVTVLAFAYATSAVKIIYLDANTYMPSGMVESSIAFSEIRDVNSCLVWINKNSPWNSTIVVQEKIQGISYSSLRFDLQIRVSPSLLTLNQAITLLPNGTDKRYAIWHKNDIAYLGFSGSEITENGNFGIFKISG